MERENLRYTAVSSKVTMEERQKLEKIAIDRFITVSELIRGLILQHFKSLEEKSKVNEKPKEVNMPKPTPEKVDDNPKPKVAKVKIKPLKDVDLEKLTEYREKTVHCNYCSSYWFYDSQNLSQRKVYNHMKKFHPQVLTT